MHEKTQHEEGASAPIFAELRAAASALVKAHPEVVRVDEAAIERLAAGARPALTAQEVKAKAERVALPLKFGNALEVRVRVCVACLSVRAYV